MKTLNSEVHLSQVCESIEELSSGKMTTHDDGSFSDGKMGKNSLVGAALVQVHNAIGTGLLLFPYTFWAFDGPVGGIAVQLVRYLVLSYKLF